MTTTKVGQSAEKKVAIFLQQNGFCVIAMNWKTRTCEIDVIAYKDQTIFFVEVKYRGNLNQGSGFEYITPNKQKRMKYAAQLWVAQHNWRGAYVLSGASIIAQGRIDFIEQL